jgi:hypothetical protein
MQPLIHDVRAARKDLPLYDDLYRRTAQIAEPVVQEALRTVTSGAATELLHTQLRGLQKFVSEDQLGPESPSDEELLNALKGFVADDVARGLDEDKELGEELAREFAIGLWDVLLRHMRRNAKGDAVQREDLEISASGDTGAKWEEIDMTLEPFGLQRTDADKILRAVLAQLSDATQGDLIKLPLGLCIDKALLARRAQPGPSQKPGAAPKGILHEGGPWMNSR